MSTYDVAQICENGHVINRYSVSYPEFNEKFCQKCGAPTIDTCSHCGTPIRGGIVDVLSTSSPPPPSFCHSCGNSFPWTSAKIEAAKELANELGNLDDDELQLLLGSIDDIVRDTPRTVVAATRFKRLAVKAGSGAVGMFKEILVDVMSEAAKKVILGP